MTEKKKEDDYVRPKKTYTDQLTETQIKEKLAGYVKVDDVQYIALRTHVRYFTPRKDGEGIKFCIGGFLKYKNISKGYVMLSQSPSDKRAKSWSVQLKGATFYRKMVPAEAMKLTIERLSARVLELEKENSELRRK